MPLGFIFTEQPNFRATLAEIIQALGCPTNELISLSMQESGDNIQGMNNCFPRFSISSFTVTLIYHWLLCRLNFCAACNRCYQDVIIAGSHFKFNSYLFHYWDLFTFYFPVCVDYPSMRAQAAHNQAEAQNLETTAGETASIDGTFGLSKGLL